MGCPPAGVAAIEHVRLLCPMPPQTEQRCGLFLRDECDLAGRPSGPGAPTIPGCPGIRTPDRARCTIDLVPCSWLMALVSWSRSSTRLVLSGSSCSIWRMRSRWAVHDWSDASRFAADSWSATGAPGGGTPPAAAASGATRRPRPPRPAPRAAPPRPPRRPPRRSAAASPPPRRRRPPPPPEAPPARTQARASARRPGPCGVEREQDGRKQEKERRVRRTAPRGTSEGRAGEGGRGHGRDARRGAAPASGGQATPRPALHANVFVRAARIGQRIGGCREEKGAERGGYGAASGTHVGSWTSNTSKHSPHCTDVSACLSEAWSRALQEGHENW